MGAPIAGKRLQAAVIQEVTPGTTPASAGGQMLDLVMESLKTEVSHDQDPHLKGILQDGASYGKVVTRRDTKGQLSFIARAHEMAFFGEMIMGTALVADYFDYNDLTPSFSIWLDRIAKVYTFDGLWVDKATFTASAGDPVLKCVLDILAQGETEGVAGTFPADIGTPYDYVDRPFIMDNLTITADAVTREIQDFSILIDRTREQDHFMNSLTRTSAVPLGFSVTGEFNFDYNATNVDLRADLMAATQIVINATFSDGTDTLAFEMANCVLTDGDPVFDGVDARKMPITFSALYDDATATDVLLLKMIDA